MKFCRIIFITLGLVLLLGSPLLTLGANLGDAKKTTNDFADSVGYQSADTKPLPVVIGTVIATIMTFLGVIFFVLVVYGGWQWLIARGNEEQITKAKGIITHATIGLAIVFAAYLISRFVVIAIMSSIVGE